MEKHFVSFLTAHMVEAQNNPDISKQLTQKCNLNTVIRLIYIFLESYFRQLSLLLLLCRSN